MQGSVPLALRLRRNSLNHWFAVPGRGRRGLPTVCSWQGGGRSQEERETAGAKDQGQFYANTRQAPGRTGDFHTLASPVSLRFLTKLHFSRYPASDFPKNTAEGRSETKLVLREPCSLLPGCFISIWTVVAGQGGAQLPLVWLAPAAKTVTVSSTKGTTHERAPRS